MKMTDLEDALWKLKQETRQLQEYRQEIQGIWDDEAAYEINSRYLNAHEGDSEKMLSSFDLQKEQLDRAVANLTVVDSLTPEIEKFAEMVKDKLEEVRKDIEHCYNLMDQSLECQAEAKAKFPTAEQLMQQARQTIG